MIVPVHKSCSYGSHANPVDECFIYRSHRKLCTSETRFFRNKHESIPTERLRHWMLKKNVGRFAWTIPEMSKTIDSFDDASTVKIGIGWIIAETFRLSTRRIEASIWEIRTSRSFRCFTPVVPSEAVGYGRQSNILLNEAWPHKGRVQVSSMTRVRGFVVGDNSNHETLCIGFFPCGHLQRLLQQFQPTTYY